ncbi:hypothetical protein SNL152K_4473 [Streptomyces sp. NL15-2K]|nr:hypothetical protein SNL152K_4473 [Streptomyces sp. NL15-2K]
MPVLIAVPVLTALGKEARGRAFGSTEPESAAEGTPVTA